MPLPDNALLSLQVHSNLGNAVQLKPKRAMIVRMSAETLEALEAFPNHPEMSVDFGDNPGIYIGETFFPMRSHKESSPHEICLRAASAAKPMAPLKLYANVIGKFILERQLGDKVTEKVRQHTMAAKQTERQAIRLNEPPIPAPGSKTTKRKLPGSGTVVKKTVVSNQLPVSSSSSLAARKVSPLPQNPPSTKASADVRRRLVHCLAISPRLADDAIRMVGGAGCSDQARADLFALMEEIAEQQALAKKGDKSPRPWTLKPQTWTEVRPYEWPKLTESERTTMSRQARLAFKALKIPETDPAWDHVRYRQTGHTIPQQAAPTPPPMAASSSSKSSSSAHVEAKRPAISSKDTKSKSKQDTGRSKGEIHMKDESAKATVSRVNAIKRAEPERSSTPSDAGGAGKTVPSRRLPGSGYQAKKSPQPSSGSTEKSSTPKPSVPASLPPKPVTATPPAGGNYARKTIPTMPPKPSKREDDSDKERDREYELIREREREHREKEKERERKRIEWERDRERAEMEKREAEKRERARLKEREEKRKEREREEMEQRLREKERLAKEKAASGPAVKRKIVAQDSDASLDPIKAPIPKRRKLDDTASSTAPSTSKVRDPRLPKKPAQEPSPVPCLKMKKEPSPLPPPRASTATQGSNTKPERSKSNGTTKIRRKSPIYTSSEDEGEIPQPRKRNPSPPPVSDRSASDQSMEKQSSPHHRARASYPSDRAGLRSLYETQYTDYIAALSKVVAQKRKVEAVLNGDTEAEADLLEPDEVHKLSTEHNSLREELEYITDLYMNGSTTGAGGSSD